MKKTRIQFDLTEPVRELLDSLAEDTGATTRAEVLRRAISIYALLLREQKAGTSVELARRDGSVRQLLVTP